MLLGLVKWITYDNETGFKKVPWSVPPTPFVWNLKALRHNTYQLHPPNPLLLFSIKSAYIKH